MKTTESFPSETLSGVGLRHTLTLFPIRFRTEHFAPQPETERYLNFICDKFGLREDIQFNTRIKSAECRDDNRSWKLTDVDGRSYTSRFLITGIGVLCNPTLPNVPGVEDFKGEACHTARWPKESVSFEGKNVAIIGTGATAIQVSFFACNSSLGENNAWIAYMRHGWIIC